MKITRILILAIILLGAVYGYIYWSFKSQLSEKTKKRITERLDAGILDSMIIISNSECLHSASEAVSALYKLNNNKPLWMDNIRLLAQADSLCAILDKCDRARYSASVRFKA